MAIVNTVYSDRFQYLDASGVAVTGLTQASYSTRVATLTAANGTVQATAPISIVEQSGGWYGYFWTPITVGNWTEEVVHSAVTPWRRWGGSVVVVTAAQGDVVAAILGAALSGGAPGTVLGSLSRIGELSVVELPLPTSTGQAIWVKEGP